MIKKILSEPLAQFLILGAMLYAVANLLGSGISPVGLGVGDNKIIVNEQVLAEYLQFQQKRFNTNKAKQLLSTMPKQVKEQLISSYVRDEVLFREAMSLALDTNDEIIRRRLIQKMEYLAQGFYDDLPEISENDLKVFFAANQDQYLIEPTITFTHIFFRKSKDTETKDSEAKAFNLLSTLKKENTPFEDAGKFGERFLYNQNYVDRTAKYIKSHFGETFQSALFSLDTSSFWQGPLKSDYGYHLVLVTKKSLGRMPDLDEVANIVLADAQQEKQRELKANAIDKLIDQYHISYQ